MGTVSLRQPINVKRHSSIFVAAFPFLFQQYLKEKTWNSFLFVKFDFNCDQCHREEKTEQQHMGIKLSLLKSHALIWESGRKKRKKHLYKFGSCLGAFCLKDCWGGLKGSGFLDAVITHQKQWLPLWATSAFCSYTPTHGGWLTLSDPFSDLTCSSHNLASLPQVISLCERWKPTLGL